MAQFLNEAGGKNASVTILTAGSEEPELANMDYWDSFTAFGITKLFAPKILRREDADIAETAERIAESSAVYIAGGSQERLYHRLSGTAVERALKKVYEKGGIVGGTSAGASIWGSVMVLDGGTSNRHLRENMIDTGDGFSWFADTAIDTHCSSRGRFPRLTALLIEQPQLQVIGIDEDTIFAVENHIAEVRGDNAVYIFDGQTSHEASQEKSMQSALSQKRKLGISGITFHCLTAGDKYDLATRRRID